MSYSDPEKQRKAQHESYLRNIEKYRTRNQRIKTERRAWLHEILVSIKCQICAEDCPTCLDLHHVNPATKEATISDLIRRTASRKRIVDEIEKCIVLCCNCHRKFHAGLVSDSGINTVKISDDEKIQLEKILTNRIRPVS